ncbi:MAG: GNAT family N-acetyltransferase [Candidatus Omnitrophica bacterium]|nr:GNAT family N-acetyltransferase [Candidatus Omnitrophota bacterium]
MEIAEAKKEDLSYIKEKIDKYLLDATNMDWKQFFVVRLKGKVVAFGRIIDRGECFEVASLGVDYYHRKKGIARKLVSYLISRARKIDPQKPIYAVTHLPAFAQACGFTLVEGDYPRILDHKIKHHCRLDASRIKVLRWKDS